MSEYTQQHPDYVAGGNFMHWVPGYEQYRRMREYFAGGYKIHVSAEPGQAAQVAAALLPLLRDMAIYHKVSTDRFTYGAMNRGPQQGKFITIYSGPLLDTFLRVTKELDAVLLANRFAPGPVPFERLSGHLKQEQSAGLSRMIFYTTSVDFTK